jgi:hypothetical protein
MMNDKNTDFPQYRMLSNGKTFYKISNERTFEEVQRMGTKKMHYKTEATQYPEMLRIQDMLRCENGIYCVISEAEWLLQTNN